MNDRGTSDGPGGLMEQLLALIGEHQDTIREALDDEEYATLLARLEALAATDADDDRAVRRACQGVRLALLRLPLDHPVYRALDSLRQVAAPPEPTAVVGARELLALLMTLPTAPEPVYGTASDPASGTAPEPAYGTAPEPAYGTAPEEDQLLLGAPALSADEARVRCGGAPPPELIRLRDPRDGDRYPEFQFTEGSGTPREVVLEVNRLLLADIDPWGAAAWWLSGNTWLGGTPASLLGRLPDHRLVGAATALVEGD
ncbi:hypothetical protein [Streptomyces sp. Ag109_G2-15]|uniref:hypothetical protein n=1 Tax=Streptomyces sp. Ag109_G2-15 TaxID=1938850 RepID=UPI000BC74686|nr:hypothetical protein [Streptomyces sp. Ag109_G2-15]SOD82534.1 hypothetical protein SAMN06272765_0617 [Streptomyces sp. Ag109_G2-15]